MNTCSRCFLSDENRISYLTCGECSGKVHVTCLKSSKPTLQGDVFYDYRCETCSQTGSDTLTRSKLPWSRAVMLALYNLVQDSNTATSHGHYHWALHICPFILRHWSTLFGSRKKPRHWKLNVMTTLNSEKYFVTKASSGYWGLAMPGTPQQLVSHYGKYHKKVSSQAKKRKKIKMSSGGIESENVVMSNNMDDELSDVSTTARGSGTDSFSETREDNDVIMPENRWSGSDDKSEGLCEVEEGKASSEEAMEAESSKGGVPIVTARRTWPWENSEQESGINSNCKLAAMSVYEETQLLRRLTAAMIATPIQVPPTSVRRLLCKLRLHSERRQRGLLAFSLVPTLQQGPRILDRYQHPTDIRRLENTGTGILPHVDPTCFISPYTNRLLKPYIRRDDESCPGWLSLQSELRNAVEALSPHLAPPPPTTVHPLDYCYVRPHHIPALNTLASTAFWPGIDLSECLVYPEFSCVVSYKRLVVGFAFMVPDIGFNEAYISFVYTRPHWRGCGIATFMLYHLIQTCLGKDVMLHVSVTNPALLLYQKFGFKVEELVQDFYDKYLPASSKECKHALSLRLCR